MSEDFSTLLEESISKLQVKTGTIINGTVIDVKKDLVIWCLTLFIISMDVYWESLVGKNMFGYGGDLYGKIILIKPIMTAYQQNLRLINL